MSTPVCPECILSATIWLSQWQQQRTLWSSSLVLFYLLFLSLCLQIWLRLRRAPARGCWTWRRRRSNGRASWRTWGSSWGSAQPRARSPTPNYSILFKCTWPALDCATNQRIHIFAVSFMNPVLLHSPIFLLASWTPLQISAERVGESAKHWTWASESSERGGWRHYRGHPFSSVSLIYQLMKGCSQGTISLTSSHHI